MTGCSKLDRATTAAINRQLGEALRDHLDADYGALPAHLKAKLAELQRAGDAAARHDPGAKPGAAHKRQ